MKCAICERECEIWEIEQHHLYPVKTRRNDNCVVKVCRQCGDQLHLMFTNTQLRTELNSLTKILSHDKIKVYRKWVKDKPLTHFSVAKKKRKK